MSHYDVGFVCLNGHAINSSANSSPQLNAPHCSDCGEEAIKECPSCNDLIRGYYHVEGVLNFSPWDVPNHCHNCGKPYPWTQRKAEAVGEMVDQLDGLDDDEREKLKDSIADIIANTPKSETAALRFKKAAGKVGKVGGQLLMDVITNVATETVKKSLGL